MRQITAIALAAILLTPPAFADTWTSSGSGQGAFFASEKAGKRLMLGCFRGAQGLHMTLLGGRKPLPATVQRNTSVMVWIELPDGRTGRYPVDTEYMGGADNALLGTLQLGRQGMEFFAAGRAIFVTDAKGTELFRSGMRGTSNARNAYRRTCGL